MIARLNAVFDDPKSDKFWNAKDVVQYFVDAAKHTATWKDLIVAYAAAGVQVPGDELRAWSYYLATQMTAADIQKIAQHRVDALNNNTPLHTITHHNGNNVDFTPATPATPDTIDSRCDTPNPAPPWP